MGYAVLHLLKPKGASFSMSAHIERTVSPPNADAELTHLNRELIEFPDTVSNRTEAIQHRIDTAGLQRKIGKNQLTAFNVLLSGSPDEMKQIEANGKLDDWCSDNLDWLRKTYGAANVVSAVVHLDESTPHIHATVVPIVTTERKKKKHEEQAKKRYRKKSPNAARLCLDEIMSREKLKEYQDTYAQAMAKFSLQRGVRGSDARHISTSEYYRELINQTETVKSKLSNLKEEQIEAQSELSKVKADISKEKFKNTAADVGTTVLDGVGSLFGNSKVKQQQQKIEALEAENHNLTDNIKGLNSKIKTMESEHKTALDKLSEQLNNIYDLFPHIKDLLRWENFLKNIGLPDNIIRRLFNREEVKGCTGELYSKEHSQRFRLENGSLKLKQDKDKPENIRLTINDTSIYEWFRQKHREFLNKLGINPPEQKNNRGLKL
ncbi:Mobilization protein BmpH [Mucinivorans hirudinis]|uniref:Mobilization protein BmpH n=1 Tax=Mucinivorans hirudinis TaxID=1433126 RepID=A0A060RAW0_9BACT|nr:Mobilization protein BmpH [Mucinivorans hirudinis]